MRGTSEECILQCGPPAGNADYSIFAASIRYRNMLDRFSQTDIRFQHTVISICDYSSEIEAGGDLGYVRFLGKHRALLLRRPEGPEEGVRGRERQWVE
jgi:hypothetical protein